MQPYLPSLSSPCSIIDCLVKRSRALLASNSTRDNQVQGASRTRGCRGYQTTAAFFFSSLERPGMASKNALRSGGGATHSLPLPVAKLLPGR